MLSSLKRGWLQLLTLTVLGVLIVTLTELWPEFFGPIGAPLLRGFGLVFLGLAAGDFGMRIIQPHVDTQRCYEIAISDRNIAAGLVYVGRMVLMAVVLMLMVTAARAGTIYDSMPAGAVKYSPLLKQDRDTYWPEMDATSLLAGQIEQETCVSLKSPVCWTPLARLKTPYEEGVNFGQITRAYDKLGNLRFDSLTTLVMRYPKDLKGFSWTNYTDAELGMKAYVLMMRDTCKSVPDAADIDNRFYFCLSAYNGGLGGLRNDILSCRATTGCKANTWFDNVEKTSLKSKVVVPGYGQSAFDINRGYVKHIAFDRRKRYLSLDA